MWFMILWGKGITSVAETWGQCNGRIKGRELFEKERGSLYPNIMSSSWADVLSEKRRTRSGRKHSFHVRPQNIKIMNRVGFFIIWNPNLEMTLQYLPERVLAQNLGASVLGAFYTEGGYLWPSLWLELGWNMQPNKQTNTHRRPKPISCVQDKYVQLCLNISLLLFIAPSPLLKFPVMSHCFGGMCILLLAQIHPPTKSSKYQGLARKKEVTSWHSSWGQQVEAHKWLRDALGSSRWEDP